MEDNFILFFEINIQSQNFYYFKFFFDDKEILEDVFSIFAKEGSLN